MTDTPSLLPQQVCPLVTNGQQQQHLLPQHSGLPVILKELMGRGKEVHTIRVPRPQLFGTQEASGICFSCGLRRNKFICVISFADIRIHLVDEKKPLSFYLQVVYYSVKNICKYSVQSHV